MPKKQKKIISPLREDLLIDWQANIFFRWLYYSKFSYNEHDVNFMSWNDKVCLVMDKYSLIFMQHGNCSKNNTQPVTYLLNVCLIIT